MSSKQRVNHTSHQTLYNDHRDHLQHPIPFPLEIKIIGEALTEREWEKFCVDHHLCNPKSHAMCKRTLDGRITFFGEASLAILRLFQEKFQNRFHCHLFCPTEEQGAQALALAHQAGIVIDELHVRNSHRRKR